MKTVYLRIIYPDWAVNSVSIAAMDQNAHILECGNIIAIVGPDNHYQAGTGVSICEGYNQRIGFHSNYPEFLT
jgi:hypothetical protein